MPITKTAMKKVCVLLAEEDRTRLDWLEEQVQRGACPGLINDDNGHWAVSFSGMQTLATGKPKDVWTAFSVSAKDWQPTLRRAIDAAMKKRKKHTKI